MGILWLRERHLADHVLKKMTSPHYLPSDVIYSGIDARSHSTLKLSGRWLSEKVAAFLLLLGLQRWRWDAQGKHRFHYPIHLQLAVQF